MPYSLAVSNPIYDNHMLQSQSEPATLIANDINAPSLPLKDKEVSNITALVRQSSVMHSNKSKNGEGIYTNTEEAKQALKQFTDYHFATPNDNQTYLITGVDCDESRPKDTYITAN
jgi:hypothetical protein